MARNQDLERIQKALNNLEEAVKKELGPLLYYLSKGLRWFNRKFFK